MASQHNSYGWQEKTRDQLRPEFQEFLDLSMVSGQVDNILCLLAFHVNCLAGFLNRQKQNLHASVLIPIYFLLTKNTLFAHSANSQNTLTRGFLPKKHHFEFWSLKSWQKCEDHTHIIHVRSDMFTHMNGLCLWKNVGKFIPYMDFLRDKT